MELIVGETKMRFPDGRTRETHTYNSICEARGGCVPVTDDEAPREVVWDFFETRQELLTDFERYVENCTLPINKVVRANGNERVVFEDGSSIRWRVRTREPEKVKPDVPEFTIETFYQDGAFGRPPGWRWRATWGDGGPTGGGMRTGASGYDSEADARRAAEGAATDIAKSILPAKKYKFTPNLET